MKKNLSYRILKRVSLSDVVRAVYPNKFVSKRGKARCPLHEDKNPSFAYRTVDGIDRWKCFAGCGSGDSISFLMKSGVCKTVRECITWLLDNGLLDVSLLTSEDEKNYLASSIGKYRARQDLLEKFCNFTKDCLLSSLDSAQECRDYFQKRGIDNVETLTSRLNIGFFDSSRLEHYGFSKKEIKSLGILGADNKYKMDKSISFMYQKTFGEFSGFKLRPLDSKKMKFFSAGGKSGEDIGFFGLNCYEGKDLYDIRNNDIILVEGEFDVLVPQYKAIHMYGDMFGIVCRSGGAASSPATFKNLRQHGISNICIFADNDKAGHEYIEKCAKSASLSNLTVDVMIPPQYSSMPGADPAEIFKSMNAVDIKDLIHDFRKPIAEYVAGVSKKDYDELATKLKDASNLRIKAINKFVDNANAYGFSDLVRDEYAAYLENLITDPLINFDRIRKELDKKTSYGKVIKIPGKGNFCVGERGYEQLIKTGPEEEGYLAKMSNFVMKYNKIVKFGTKDAFEIEGDIIVNGKKSGAPFTISSKELVTPEQFNNLIRTRHPIGIEGLHALKPFLPELVSLSNAETPIYTGVDRVGYLEKTRTYVTPSVIIEDGQFTKNEDYNVVKSDSTICTFFNSIDFDMEELEDHDALKEAMDLLTDSYLECLPRRTTLMTLGHVYGSVLTPYFVRKIPPHALFFRGLAGSFKSTFAQITMGLFYKDPFDIKWLHARDTPYSIEMALSYVDNAPMVLDDIKSERQNAEDVMMIIQSLYDEQGRSRLNRDLTVRQGRSVANQGLIVTGEIIPTTQLSILSRMVQIEFKRSEANTRVFSHLQDNIGTLRKLTPHFIKWLQKKYEATNLKIRSFPVVDIPDYERERSYHQISKMVTGLDCFLTFLEEEVGLNPTTKTKLMKEAEIYALDLLKANLTRIKAVSKESVLIEDISAMLKTGFLSVWGAQQGAVEIGTTDENGDIIISINRLKIGLRKNNMHDKINQVGQVITDLSYQGRCKCIDKDRVWFPKDELLSDDLGIDKDLHIDDTNTHQAPDAGGPGGLNG